MSFTESHETKERVRQAVDIVELVERWIPLRRQGANFVGQCPWHDDNSPSLQVNRDRQTWKCWVCNIGGDVFNFVMKRDNVNFREAMETLADLTGIEIKNTPSAPLVPGSPNDKKTLYAAVQWAESQFHECLLHGNEGEEARDYLRERGLNAASIEKFRIGFAPDSWNWLLDRSRKTTYSAAVLEAVNLATRSDRSGRFYDRFRGRVMFPIRDTQDRPVAFGGRVMPGSDNNAKYINSAETKLFTKSEQAYGLNVARQAIAKSKRVVVVEGYTDTIMAHQFGINDAVAVLGTAINDRHIRLLKRFADQVILVLDGDTAGQNQANNVLGLFVKADVNLRILTLPDGSDPCDFLLTQGTEKFSELLDGATDALEHRIKTATNGIQLATDTHAAHQALESILSTLALNWSGNLRQEQVLSRLARQFRVSTEKIRTHLNELRKTIRSQDSRAGRRVADGSVDAWSESSADPFAGFDLSMTPQERELLEILLVHPDLIERSLNVLTPEEINGDAARNIYTVIEQMFAAGIPCGFNNVMLEVEEERLKTLLIDLEEKGSLKEELAQEDAQERLTALLDYFELQRAEPARREKLAALDSSEIEENEAIDILKQLIDEQRNRQGVSAPTDG